MQPTDDEFWILLVDDIGVAVAGIQECLIVPMLPEVSGMEEKLVGGKTSLEAPNGVTPSLKDVVKELKKTAEELRTHLETHESEGKPGWPQEITLLIDAVDKLLALIENPDH
jgi:hypothetical protein